MLELNRVATLVMTLQVSERLKAPRALNITLAGCGRLEQAFYGAEALCLLFRQTAVLQQEREQSQIWVVFRN